MISARLLSLARCPDCGGGLAAAPPAGGVRCLGCGREYDASRGYLDLRPARAFAEQTLYLDESLHADARHETVAPPLLGSWVRDRMLRRFLRLAPADRVLDLGCGSGRTLVWHAGEAGEMTGVDISPFFSRDALGRMDLLLGDLRRLPIRDDAFTKAWSLDVFEHLSPQALSDVLAEAHRVLAPGGALFVYSHVRKNGWIAKGVRVVNALARVVERVGLLDLRQERLRKSDHLNPIADHDELRAVAANAGFEIERLTYYTPILGSLIENVFVRMAEQILKRVSSGANAEMHSSSGGDERRPADAAVRARAKAITRRRGAIYFALRGLSALMMLDVLLFGRFRSGPFFALLRKPA